MPHDHDSSEPHGSALDPMAARVMALETILTEKGWSIPRRSTRWSRPTRPRSGRATARGWWRGPGPTRPTPTGCGRCDGGHRRAGLSAGRQGEHMRAVFNTPDEHNLVVCTLCSCYPWAVLGLPPVWYKSPPYRSRAVIEPRGVLAEFGLTLPAQTKIRVWDSTAELRYLVVPMRPGGQRGAGRGRRSPRWSRRDSMIGTGLATAAHERGAGSRRADGLRAGGAGARRAGLPCRLGAPGDGADAASAMGALAARRDAACPREPAAGATISRRATTRSGSRRWSGCCCATASSPRPSSTAGHRLTPGTGPKRVLRGAECAGALRRGAPADRDPPGRTPAFAAGDAVRPIVMHPAGHTRLPRYARGKRGASRRCRAFMCCRTATPTGAARRRNGSTPWSSTPARSGAGTRKPMPTLSIDAWESYLERA